MCDMFNLGARRKPSGWKYCSSFWEEMSFVILIARKLNESAAKSNYLLGDFDSRFKNNQICLDCIAYS